MWGADADHDEIIPVQRGKNVSEQLGTHGGGRTARERRSFLLGELAATCSDLRPTEERTCTISGCSGAAKIVPDRGRGSIGTDPSQNIGLVACWSGRNLTIGTKATQEGNRGGDHLNCTSGAPRSLRRSRGTPS